MTTRHIAKLSTAIAAALLVAACGGSGGGDRPGLAPRPPEPPPAPLRDPNAASGVIGEADTSQTFASEGQNIWALGNLAIRYHAATDEYFVTVPEQSESLLVNDPCCDPATTDSFLGGIGGTGIWTHVSSDATDPALNYQYSNLATFNSASGLGATAFGIATPASAVPVTGTASFSGLLRGYSSEQVDWGDWGMFAVEITGSIELAFDFGAGSLSGSLHPYWVDQDLGVLTFSQPVWGVGLNSFSAGLTGSVLTGAPAGITGQFTGPAAQELIGSFFFGYVSPVSGLDARAAGAFVARR